MIAPVASLTTTVSGINATVPVVGSVVASIRIAEAATPSSVAVIGVLLLVLTWIGPVEFVDNTEPAPLGCAYAVIVKSCVPAVAWTPIEHDSEPPSLIVLQAEDDLFRSSVCGFEPSVRMTNDVVLSEMYCGLRVPLLL
jgi:hypothetical protein